jgi:hypothetical protein
MRSFFKEVKKCQEDDNVRSQPYLLVNEKTRECESFPNEVCLAWLKNSHTLKNGYTHLCCVPGPAGGIRSEGEFLKEHYWPWLFKKSGFKGYYENNTNKKKGGVYISLDAPRNILLTAATLARLPWDVHEDFRIEKMVEYMKKFEVSPPVALLSAYFYRGEKYIASRRGPHSLFDTGLTVRSASAFIYGEQLEKRHLDDPFNGGDWGRGVEKTLNRYSHGPLVIDLIESALKESGKKVDRSSNILTLESEKEIPGTDEIVVNTIDNLRRFR